MITEEKLNEIKTLLKTLTVAELLGVIELCYAEIKSRGSEMIVGFKMLFDRLSDKGKK